MSQVVRVFEAQPQSFADAVQAFLSVCRAKNLSPNTVSYYSYRLQSFSRFMESVGLQLAPSEVTPSIIREFLTHERESNSATTAQHSVITLRAFYSYLVSEGFVSSNPALAVEKPRRKKTVIPTLATEQCAAILATCGKDFYGVRDRAILLTLMDTGVRVQELSNLRFWDVSLEQQTMKVLGKGDKERIVPFGSGVRAALASYLVRRGESRAEEFFVNHYGEPLSRHAVLRMIKRRGEAAGITGVRLSPHTLRHTFAKTWLINGGDAFSLQRMLGHTTLDMVRSYVNLASSEVQDVHRCCSPVDRMEAGRDTRRRRIS